MGARNPTGMTASTPFIVTETDDLDSADAAGLVNVSPGETKTVAEHRVRSNRAYLLAIGAADHDETDYRLKVDSDLRFSTRSPLGLVNEPFSLKNKLGFLYPANKLIEYEVSVDATASSGKTFAARMFVTEEEVNR